MCVSFHVYKLTLAVYPDMEEKVAKSKERSGGDECYL